MMTLKVESQELNEMEEKDQCGKHDFTDGEKLFSCSQTEKTSSQNIAQKTGTRSYFTCQQRGKGFNRKQNLQST